MGTVIKKYGINTVLAVVLLVLAMGLTPRQVHSNSYPALNDYANWSVLWWQWAYTQPWQTNPVWDTSVSAPYAGLNQQGPVWFLGGHFDKSLIDNFPVIRGSSTHPLTIPNGKYLFFPIVNMADVNGIEVPGKILVDNQDTARKMVGDYLDSITKIICTLDDTPVVYNHLTPIVRTQTPNLNLSPNPNDFGFTITLPTDSVVDHIYWDIFNYCHVPAGDWDKSVADGYYVMLQQLTPGEHVIHFEAYIGSDVVQNVTYYVAAPLPGTLLLLGTGLAGLLGFGVRRRM